MHQQSFSTDEFEKYQKKTRKLLFLEQMEQFIPLHKLSEAISPYYPKEPKGTGRKPVGLLRMLKIHFLHHGVELSDLAAEETLYDTPSMRRFVDIDLDREPVPNETTICKFRHLMKKHNLGDELFSLVNVYLSENGLKARRGTLVDASIINAPTSTKNKSKQSDPDMHQTRKSNP